MTVPHGAGIARAAIALGVMLTGLDQAFAQAAVPTIASREGSRATGRTGAPIYASPAVPDNPHAWPLPDGGAGWPTVGLPLGNPYPSISVGQVFDTDGLTPATPPQTAYTWDRYGNIIYQNPSLGFAETYGTTIQNLK